MEDVEIIHIDTNIFQLIKLTSSTTEVKALLKERHLITDEEEEQLTLAGRYHGRTEESKLLYDLLKTRKDGYRILMEIMQRTNQTGALEILKATMPASHVKISSAEQLLDLPVQICNKVMLVREVIPFWTTDDTIEVLRDIGIYRDFIEVFKNGAPLIQLEVEIPDLEKLYIPRSISNRLLLDPKIFKMNCPDVFVFQGCPSSILKSLIEPYFFRQSTDQRSKITCRHIYLDDLEDWDDMVWVSRKPIHLVSKEGNDYVLLRSTEFTEILHENCLNKLKRQHAYVTEDKFVDQFLDVHNPAGALLCDVPGMGKTWLMQSIAKKVRIKSANSLVFFVQLSSFGQFLGENFDHQKEHIDPLYVTLDFCYRSKLTAMLVRELANASKRNFIFILDGFDEIRDVHIKTTMSVLNDLFQLENIQFIISSRPHMRKLLENTFKLLSYDILPFGREDQVKAIVGHWMETIPYAVEPKVAEYAQSCIDAINIVPMMNHEDFLGNPLKCYILATVNEVYGRLLCKPDRQKDIQINKFATFDSIASLYEKFVDVLIGKVVKSLSHAENDMYEKIISFHIYKALELLFPQLSELFYQSLNVDQSKLHIIIRIGVLRPNSTCGQDFIHRSFAEYFAGRFFAALWMHLEAYEPGLRKAAVAFFLRNVLKTPVWVYSHNARLRFNHHTVLWFFNCIYQEKSPLLSSYLTDNLRDIPFQFCEPNTPVALLACIDGALISLLSLLVQLLTIFVEDDRRYMYLIAKEETEKNFLDLCKFLNHVALFGTQEAAHELFKLCDSQEHNTLLKFCLTYPQRNEPGPMDFALTRNNLDMVAFFASKAGQYPEWLLRKCLIGKKDTLDIDSRVMVLNRAFVGAEAVLKILCDGRIFTAGSESFTYISLEVLTKYAWKHNMSGKSINLDNKLGFFKIALCISKYSWGYPPRRAVNSSNDKIILKVIVWLFGKPGPKTLDVYDEFFKEELHTPDEDCSYPPAEAVLQILDLKEANEIFAAAVVDLRSKQDWIKNIKKFQTLQVLTTILPNISTPCCGYNYLHLAVLHAEYKTVEHLLILGQNVNEKGKSYTPLQLCAQNQKCLDIFDLLVKYGADVFVRDKDNSTIAHLMVLLATDTEKTFKWVNHLVDKGYTQLWSIRDSTGDTPYSYLRRTWGSPHELPDGFVSTLCNRGLHVDGSERRNDSSCYIL